MRPRGSYFVNKLGINAILLWFKISDNSDRGPRPGRNPLAYGPGYRWSFGLSL